MTSGEGVGLEKTVEQEDILNKKNTEAQPYEGSYSGLAIIYTYIAVTLTQWEPFAINRGYYMAARRYEISLRQTKINRCTRCGSPVA